MQDYEKKTNAELLYIYEHLQGMDELDPLMNEAVNRLAWYIDSGKVPPEDTGKETYRQWKD